MKKHLLISAFVCILAPSNFALAQTAQNMDQNDIIPAASVQEDESKDIDQNIVTHPPLRLTPDKSEIINIDKPVGSVVIGNPNHVNILVDSPQRLIAVPRAAGASFFSVLDDDGGIIMQRHVIVASPKEKYVRIRRVCGDTECQPTSVYYCPDMCHEIQMSTESSGGDSSALADSTAADGQTSQDTASPDQINQELP